MSTKAELLSKLTKPQLLEIAKNRGIIVKPSLSKDDIADLLATKLTKVEVERFVSRYVKVRAEREVTEKVRVIEHERKIREKVEAQGLVSTARVRVEKSREELIQDILRAIRLYDYPEEELIREYKRRTGELIEAKAPTDILFRAPQDFLEYMYQMFYTTRAGRGIEYRFLKWLKENDKYIGYLSREKPKSIKIRTKLRGKTGALHEIDIYVSAKLGIREQMKLGFNPLDVIIPWLRLEYFVECKSRRNPIDVDVINDFKGKVEDICELEKVEPTRAMLVSSTDFTEDAVKYASGIKARGVHIELIKEVLAGQFVKVFPVDRR